jgi:hypothetical protein
LERQHGNRRLVRQHQRGLLPGSRNTIPHLEHAHRPVDVLEILLAGIVERDVQFVADLPVRVVGDANASGLRNGFQTRRHVDAVAEYVAVIFYDIADIETDTEFDPVVCRQIQVAFRHAALDREGTAHRVHDAAELGQKAVAGMLDDMSAMRGDFRIDQNPQMVLEPDVRAFLIETRQPAVTGDIGREYACKPPHQLVACQKHPHAGSVEGLKPDCRCNRKCGST